MKILQLPLSFEYAEDIEPPNRGYQVDKLTAVLDGNEVGYIKPAYIPRANIKKFLPTTFNYLSDFQGWSRVASKDGSQPDLESVDFWRGITLNASRLFAWHYSQSKEPPPLEKRLADIEKVVKFYHYDFTAFKKRIVDKPYVDYIYVDPNLRRNGIGLALYMRAAYLLAENGFSLYASSCQSDAAAACWRYMRDNGYPVIRERVSKYQKSPRYKLAY